MLVAIYTLPTRLIPGRVARHGRYICKTFATIKNFPPAHLRTYKKVGPKTAQLVDLRPPPVPPDLYIEGSQCVMYMFDLDLNTC